MALQEFALLMFPHTTQVVETAEVLAVVKPLITTAVLGEMEDVLPNIPMIGKNKARQESSEHLVQVDLALMANAAGGGGGGYFGGGGNNNATYSLTCLVDAFLQRGH